MQTQTYTHTPAATMRDVIATIAELPDERLQEAYEFLFRLTESDDPNFSDEGISPAELARRNAIDVALADAAMADLKAGRETARPFDEFIAELEAERPERLAA